MFQMIADSLNKEEPNPPSSPVGAIPLCMSGVVPFCYTMVYAPRDNQTDAIVKYLADHRQGGALSIGYDPNTHDTDIIGFNTEGEMKSYVVKNPNTTLMAVRFLSKQHYLDTFGSVNDVSFLNETAEPVIYQLWYNDSMVDDGYDVRLEFTRAIHGTVYMYRYIDIMNHQHVKWILFDVHTACIACCHV